MCRRIAIFVGLMILTQTVQAGPIPVKTPGIAADESIAYRPVATPIIDGDLSDWLEDPETEWTGAAFKFFGEQEYILRGDWGGPEDSSILWSVMWDDTFLYFAAAIWDDVLTPAPDLAGAWRGDCIFLYFDSDADGQLDHLSNILLFEEEAYVISWGNANIDPDRVPYPDGQAAIVMDDRLGPAGRFVEAAIPLADMWDMHAEVGGEFRLNVGLEEGNQDPDGGKFLSWTGPLEPGDNGNQRSVYFSDLIFLADIAAYPDPVHQATDVPQDVTLTWRAGKFADSHDIYFGTEFEDVNAADNTPGAWPVYQGNQDPCSFDPGQLTIGQTYYWRVDEVNAAQDISIYRGDVWSFTAVNFVVVDDFEDYNDYAPHDIFTTWKDGYGTDDNGALIGYDAADIAADEHFVETEIIHSGKQSLPYFYNNDKKFSEAWRTLDSVRDWTADDMVDLSLRFIGNPPPVGGFVEEPAGTYTITSTGTDIWAGSDEFHFAFKQVNGSAKIIAKVDSLESTHEFAKVGVMIRDTLDPDSKYLGVFITPENGVRFQYRNAVGGVTDREFVEGITAPQWIRLERTTGGLVRAYYSADGTTWEQFSLLQVSMTMPVYTGLAVTSHDINLTCDAVFSNVSFPDTIVDDQWIDQDIGMLSNKAAPMYVALSNSTGDPAVVYHDDPNVAQIDIWTEWVIPLQVFADKGVDLTDVDRIAIGFGDRDNPQQNSGDGTMFFDDIRLYRSREAAE